MLKKISNIMIVILTGIFIFSFSILCIIKEPSAYSMSERRKLAQFPTINIETILSGKTAKQINDYVVDQFPFRDVLMNMHLSFSKDVLKKKDINKLYIRNDDALAMEYPLNQKSLQHASSLFSKIHQKYLKNANKVYFSIIPDKSYFLNDKDYLKLDYDTFFNEMKKQNQQMQYIDIIDHLCLEDYYQSDPHWRQEKIMDIAQLLGSHMNVEIEKNYDVIEVESLFHGSYYHQAPNILKPEKMYYLTNETIKNCNVYDHQNKQAISMYDFKKVNDKDPYEFYLSGPLSYITITNPKIKNGKELIVFRDSFGSSIAPLLATGYEKITLLDIRYLPSDTLGKYINFDAKDVLFLYNVSILNHSETLK